MKVAIICGISMVAIVGAMVGWAIYSKEPDFKGYFEGK